MYKKDTTHVVIKFIKKSKYGKESIDFVPISWTFTENKKLYCKYPADSDEYKTIDKMSKIQLFMNLCGVTLKY